MLRLGQRPAQLLARRASPVLQGLPIQLIVAVLPIPRLRAVSPLPLAPPVQPIVPLPLALPAQPIVPLPLALPARPIVPLPLALPAQPIAPLPLALPARPIAPLPLALPAQPVELLPLALPAQPVELLPLAPLELPIAPAARAVLREALLLEQAALPVSLAQPRSAKLPGFVKTLFHYLQILISTPGYAFPVRQIQTPHIHTRSDPYWPRHLLRHPVGPQPPEFQ